MTKNEFIAYAAVHMLASGRAESFNPEAIDEAEWLARDLEERGWAPWQLDAQGAAPWSRTPPATVVAKPPVDRAYRWTWIRDE